MDKSRISRLPWPEIHASLWELGYGRLGMLLSQPECERLRGLYADSSLFRSRIDMARFRFGSGEYQYFTNPLPSIVAALREALYPPLVATPTVG
jgi:uncharacterized protein